MGSATTSVVLAVRSLLSLQSIAFSSCQKNKTMPLAYISELAARNFKSNAGIYIISEHPPTKKGIRLVKIGRSIDVRKRLNAYHICWPQGFHIWMLIKLSDKTRELAKPQRIEVSARETAVY